MAARQETANRGAGERQRTGGDNAIAATWFGQVLRRSRALVLLMSAYLGAIAVILKWFKGEFELLYDQHPIVFWTLTLGPVLFIALFDMTPRLLQTYLRRRREDMALQPISTTSIDPYFRLDPYVPTDRADFLRKDNAHQRVLRWISDSDRPLLFLSGASGAGKSSVLEGFVLPELRAKGWRVVQEHGYADPLGSLEEALAAPRRRSIKLLLVFDQFEEFVILEKEIGSDRRQMFVERVRVLRREPPPGVCLLFAFRLDYQGAIEELKFDELNSRSNWVEISPFGRADARAFLEDSPPKPARELVERLLNGADALDEIPGLYRPVTLNIIGLMFQPFDRRFTSTPERQVQTYLEAAISEPAIREIAPRVIRQLITGSNTKRAQTVFDLSQATELREADVLACVNRLAAKGLARRLGDDNSLWELSHDFLVKQFAILLRQFQPDRWVRRARYAIPPLFVAFLVGSVFAVHEYPKVREQQALRGLERLNVSVTGDGDTREATFCKTENASEGGSKIGYSCPYGDPNWRLAQGVPLLAAVGIYNVDLNDTDTDDLDPLRGFPSVVRLHISGDHVKTLAPLSTTTRLVELDASANEIADLEPLRHLASLTSLDLSENDVATLQPLAGLTGLVTLQLQGNPIVDLSPLHDLTAIETLNVSETHVADLSPIRGLATLNHLNISKTSVQDLSPLLQLNNLSTLEMDGVPVQNLAVLSRLPGLRDVYLGKRALSSDDQAVITELKTVKHVSVRGP